MISLLIIAIYIACITAYSIVHTTLTFSILFFTVIFQNLTSIKNAPSLNPINFILSCIIENFWLIINNNIKIFKHINFNKKKSNKPIVILIHGFAQSKLYWHLFNFRMKKDYNIFSFNFENGASKIQTLAAELKTEINKLLPKNKKIIIIGHSMGGLVATYYAENLAPPNQIKGIITITSPFHGTHLSILASGASVKQMAIKSRFLATLRNKLKTSKNKYLHIGTKLDNVILPWQSTIPDFNKKNYKILNFYGHQSTLYSTKTIAFIKTWLKANKP